MGINTKWISNTARNKGNKQSHRFYPITLICKYKELKKKLAVTHMSIIPFVNNLNETHSFKTITPRSIHYIAN